MLKLDKVVSLEGFTIPLIFIYVKYRVSLLKRSELDELIMARSIICNYKGIKRIFIVLMATVLVNTTMLATEPHSSKGSNDLSSNERKEYKWPIEFKPIDLDFKIPVYMDVGLYYSLIANTKFLKLVDPNFLEEFKEDSSLKNAYKDYVLSYLKREKQKLEESNAVISMTNRMGFIIFIVVHISLGISLCIALMEFNHARKARRLKKDTQELELSFEKIAFKTSLHGTILLILSLVLYFLFLKFVFPITVIG